jgi:hypothetical protein
VSTGRWLNIERDAHLILDELRTGRQSKLVCTDSYWRDVWARLQQLLEGDVDPPFGDQSHQ